MIIEQVTSVEQQQSSHVQRAGYIQVDHNHGAGVRDISVGVSCGFLRVWVADLPPTLPLHSERLGDSGPLHPLNQGCIYVMSIFGEKNPQIHLASLKFCGFGTYPHLLWLLTSYLLPSVGGKNAAYQSEGYGVRLLAWGC